MKFHQLPIGSRFRYQEREYCKTSPLAASGEGGQQRMIPRSAIVSLLGDNTSAEDAADESRQPPEALRHHHERCRTLLEQAAAQLPENTRLALMKALEDSYREMTDALQAAD